MSSMPRTEHHCSIRADKTYTNFTWCLEDWTLLRDHYKSVVSPKFVLHDTDGKTCKLTFVTPIRDYHVSMDIKFPTRIEYHAMKTSLSFIDENSVKLATTEKIFRNSEECCTLKFAFSLSDSVASQYLRNDTLTLFFEVTIVKSVKDSALRTDIRDPDFSTEISQNFKVILDSKDFYDVTFVVRGKKLYAHKVILAANSEVFRAMFTTEMKELKDDTVEIVDTDATVFEAFLCYMYTGRVSEIGNIVDELIVVADKYQVINLKIVCERYMSEYINNDTAITYLLKAHLLSCTKLQKKCIDFIRVNIHVLKNPSNLAKISEYPSIVSQVFDKEPTA